jgi:hypothetical protein
MTEITPTEDSEVSTCVICIEERNIDDFIGLWQCQHLFCKICVQYAIQKGITTCFLCRSVRKNIGHNLDHNNIYNNAFSNNENYSSNCKVNVMNINNIRNIVNVPTNNIPYLELWEKRVCIQENHEFVIRQPYGVIMICVQCNLIQCFNLLV